MTDQLRLSPSKLDMLSKCGVQYEYRYVKGLKIPPSVGMLEGRAIDKAASAILRHKLAEGTLPTDEAVADHAGQEMRTEWNDAGEVLIPASEALRGGKGRLGYAVDRVAAGEWTAESAPMNLALDAAWDAIAARPVQPPA